MAKNTHKLGLITEAEALKLAPKLFTKKGDGDSRWDRFTGDEWNMKYKKGDLCVLVDGGYGDEPIEFKLVKITSVGMDMIGEPKIRVGDDQYTWRVSGTMRKI